MTNSSRRLTNPGIDASPVVELESPRKQPTGGRGRSRKLAPMPLMPMSNAERTLFDDFIAEYLREYPDLTQTDYRLLHLAAIEYIKYLRIAAQELESGQVISMARQHPGTNMRALLDQLSTTRKQRTRGTKSNEPEEAEELRQLLLSISKS